MDPSITARERERDMTAYVTRRFAYALLTFLGITVATFALVHAVPGDPVSFYIGRAGIGSVSPAVLDSVRREYHLDEPLPVQYMHWLRAAASLDFGRSIVHRRPVRAVIAEKLPRTILLNLVAFVLAAAIGIPVGLWSAARRGSAAERAMALGAYLLYSLPSFWVALLLIHWLSVRLGWLPLFGMHSDAYAELSAGGRLWDRLVHMILPVVTLAYAQVAIFARFSRAATVEVIGQDFITAARARGASPAALLWHHAFRNSLIPLISLLGLAIPFLMSGSVIVERIFQWDGIGLLYFEAILARDYTMVMGMTVVTAMVTLFASVLADLLYGLADPRIRLEGTR